MRRDSEKDLVNLDVVPDVVAHRTTNPADVHSILKQTEQPHNEIAPELAPPPGPPPVPPLTALTGQQQEKSEAPQQPSEGYLDFYHPRSDSLELEEFTEVEATPITESPGAGFRQAVKESEPRSQLMPSSQKPTLLPTRDSVEEDKSGTHTPPRKAEQKQLISSKAVTLPARHSPSSIPKPTIGSYGATRTRFGFGTSPGPSASTGPPKVPPPPAVFTKS